MAFLLVSIFSVSGSQPCSRDSCARLSNEPRSAPGSRRLRAGGRAVVVALRHDALRRDVRVAVPTRLVPVIAYDETVGAQNRSSLGAISLGRRGTQCLALRMGRRRAEGRSVRATRCASLCAPRPFRCRGGRPTPRRRGRGDQRSTAQARPRRRHERAWDFRPHRRRGDGSMRSLDGTPCTRSRSQPRGPDRLQALAIRPAPL